MIAICHFVALAKSNLFLVKLGSKSLFIWARILNIRYLFIAKIEKTTEFGSLFCIYYENNFDFSDCLAFTSSTFACSFFIFILSKLNRAAINVLYISRYCL